MNNFLTVSICFLLLLACKSEPDEPAYEISDNVASAMHRNPIQNSAESMVRPYVILVSIDGMRHDYDKIHRAGFLSELPVQADRLNPVFPSSTFPNHYSLATGLYPENHGIISNRIYDRETDLYYSNRDREQIHNPLWYEGTPLWVLAREQQMVTASMFWVGTEAPVNNIQPDYYFDYNGSFSHKDRVNVVLNWLQLPEGVRPHLITLYFSAVDSKGHANGPESAKVGEALKEIDQQLQRLKSETDQMDLPINLIVVSDHGMIDIKRNEAIDLSEYNNREGLAIARSFPVMFYSEDSAQISDIFRGLQGDSRYEIYLKEDLPRQFHMDHQRTGDLMLVPRAPYGVTFERGGSLSYSGAHGFDPAVTPEMGGVFYASGPAFKETRIPEIEAIDVYPLIAKILGLEYGEIDGKLDRVEELLRESNR